MPTFYTRLFINASITLARLSDVVGAVASRHLTVDVGNNPMATGPLSADPADAFLAWPYTVELSADARLLPAGPYVSQVAHVLASLRRAGMQVVPSGEFEADLVA